MATSQNGWPVYTSSASLRPFPWVTGRLCDGDVFVAFDYLCRRFDAEVEAIIVAHSWAYAYRAIRGRVSGYSNHASATAIDLNAPAHPLGRRGTFNGAQRAAIHRILSDLDGAIRWGGDYSGRPDEMHFEVNTSAAHLAAVVRNITTNEEDEMTPADKEWLAGQFAAVHRKLDLDRSQQGNQNINRVLPKVREILRVVKGGK